MRAKSLAGQTSNLESLPLFATDDAIGAALLGPKRVAEFKQIVPLLEARGLPKVDQLIPHSPDDALILARRAAIQI